MIRILIVDDHQMVGEGTKNMIEKEVDFDVTYVEDAWQAINMSHKELFDLYLLDINMPNVSGLEMSRHIFESQPEAKIILYTGLEYASQYNVLVESGISGIISKSASKQELLILIRSVLNGYTSIPISLFQKLRLSEVGGQDEGITNPNSRTEISETVIFTEKEIDILTGIAKGKSTKEIAEELFASARSVEYNITKIFRKLDVSTRSEALAEALRRGLVLVK